MSVDREALRYRGLRRARSVALLTAGAALVCAGCGADAPRSTIDPAPYVKRGHVVDCGAFRSQADAQAVLRADPTDPNGLDRDGDGIACTTLPGPTDTNAVQRQFVTDEGGAPVLLPLRKQVCRQLTGRACKGDG